MTDTIAYVEHAADVLKAAADAIDAGTAFALITSVAISGGSARPLGSLALVTADGDMVGYLSNGCIDQDIRIRGLTAIESGTRGVYRYGEGSRYVDLKLPCGGSLTVLVDPQPDVANLKRAHETLQGRRPATFTFDVDGDGPKTFTYRPKNRLILAGRGAAFRATANVAVAAGFEVGVVSPEAPDLAALADITQLPAIHLTTPDEAPKLTHLDAHAAFLTMFHDHDWEPALLQSALASPAPFIGCLGSRAAQAQRKAMLSAMGTSPADLDRIRGPIGLVGSLRDAQLIAISAMAEVVQSLTPSVIKG